MNHTMTMSRPPVSIDRLPGPRGSAEPREVMNCRSCRKRKIKCTRLRPCEACRVYQCVCVYDAVPKKRGPKTDVLETLKKRVDRLEKRLQNEKDSTQLRSVRRGRDVVARESVTSDYPDPRLAGVLPPSFLDAYFSRIHGKPYFILDELVTRLRYQSGQLPLCLAMAICALTVRYTHSNGGQTLEYAMQARRMVEIDDPTIEGLQALLLLSQAFFAHGLGKKAYMTFSNCVAMAMALDLHREIPSQDMLPSERETRRFLFWTTFLMDCFTTCGSTRPFLIADQSISLRLSSCQNADGEMFNPAGSNISCSGRPAASTVLIDITRILRLTNQHLATNASKGDQHALSSVSNIRYELSIWATGTQDIFTSSEALFSHRENTTLLLSRLIYHLIHCLLYRPFLPLDLRDQHQTWQTEIIRLCFPHANAITELVEFGRISPVAIEWPAIVAYCVCVAGSVHIHGMHYGSANYGDDECPSEDKEVFSSSVELLTREMDQLSWLGEHWTGVRHHHELLQSMYTYHTSQSPSPSAYRHFIHRYPDMAHVRLVDGHEPPPIHKEPMPLQFPSSGLSPPDLLATVPEQGHQLLTPDTQPQSPPKSSDDWMENGPFLSILEGIAEHDLDNEWRGLFLDSDGPEIKAGVQT